jgi:indolepyruvate ferredoxin oxidoreductase
MATVELTGEAGRRTGAPERALPARRPVALSDRYELERGRVFMSGVQALVRVPLDQHRADRRRGLRTGTLVSGYQGSPLGGLDKELQRIRELCRAHHVVHVPGLNEELGATSGWGAQLAAELPGARYDGVLSVWYGKAPGLDRATDALRHANLSGTSRTGGALALVGDDPSCKSSTLPSASESLLQSLHVPTFFPGNVQEALDLGLHALACSRASGLWSALKVVTAVADATGTVEVAPERIDPVLPVVEWQGRPYEHRPDANILAPASLELERTLLGPRTELALAYARENGVNRIEGARGDAWLGIATAGKAYHDVRQALGDLGLEERDLERAGVRILRLGMIWPLEPGVVREFARGLDEVVVVEEKRAFLEPLLKEALYGVAGAPRIVGKRDEHGATLVPAEGELDPDAIARVLGERLRRRVSLDSVEARLATLEAVRGRRVPLPIAVRTPFFCSGCPHNSSTPAPDGTLVGAGIGCHTMILLNREGRGEITGITQMGGEGAQWIGMAPFTDDEHFVQNLGDGTFTHSGSLAIRAAVAAGVNVTYKLLVNGAVAMTGGQKVEGEMAVPELTRWLELEGVRRVIVTTEEPKRYRRARLAAVAEVRPRSELIAAQEELAREPGVTVLIHDQQCAAEKRRLRKRGKLPEATERVLINERVCEGCGDCGKKSSCLSVLPVETEFGRKTQIHQSSCNVDMTCLEGDCPSFLTVVPGKRAAAERPAPPAGLPEPEPIVEADSFSVRMMGIGGTGVVTVSQVLGMAALIDGRHVAGLDQTGLSQKGGPVTSDLRISREPVAGASKATRAALDLYLAFDVLGATQPQNLATCHPERTVAVVSTAAVPTGRMVVDPDARFPDGDAQLAQIAAVTRRDANVALDAQELAERLCGDHMQANVVALGAAFQRGAIPLSLAAIEEAFRLNGAAVERNLAAFAWGRASVAAPEAIEAALRAASPALAVEAPARELDEELRALVDRVAREGELRRLLEVRVPELVAYQDRAYAEDYLRFVERVRAAEEERMPGRSELTEAVARQLYKLMAYKDEYEVARLHLDPVERARVEAELGEGARAKVNLHPPLLRALGMKRKVKLGRWFDPGLRMLRAGRRLRGTALDPFGRTEVRRVERELIGEYRAIVADTLGSLRPETYATAVELCDLPDVVRGYEEIKLRNVERFRRRAGELRARLDEGAQPTAEAPAVVTVPANGHAHGPTG